MNEEANRKLAQIRLRLMPEPAAAERKRAVRRARRPFPKAATEHHVVFRGLLWSVMWGPGFGFRIRVHRWFGPARKRAYKDETWVTHHVSFNSDDYRHLRAAADRYHVSPQVYIKRAVMAALNEEEAA